MTPVGWQGIRQTLPRKAPAALGTSRAAQRHSSPHHPYTQGKCTSIKHAPGHCLQLLAWTDAMAVLQQGNGNCAPALDSRVPYPVLSLRLEGEGTMLTHLLC